MPGQNNNIKYVHPIMGYEVAIDQNNKIVTDPLNVGTYNFYNPYMGQNNPLLEDSSFVSGRHSAYDITPYNLLGNSPNDPTNSSQRTWRFMQPLKE